MKLLNITSRNLTKCNIRTNFNYLNSEAVYNYDADGNRKGRFKAHMELFQQHSIRGSEQKKKC